MDPIISRYFLRRDYSVIGLAQIEFAKRCDSVLAVNVDIGIVFLPMHPAMIHRMANLKCVLPMSNPRIEWKECRFYSKNCYPAMKRVKLTKEQYGSTDWT